MGRETLIAWTDHTFNIAWGCTRVSEGCRNCYADTLSRRWGWKSLWKGERRTFGERHWLEPLKWKPGAKVFCSSMCDVFEEHSVLEREREKLWHLIRATPHLKWLILTKRPERILSCLPRDWGRGYENVWLGTTIEHISYGSRARALEKVPARVRFISYEPALGPLDSLDLSGIDWVIYGGESGPGFRAHDLNWARRMRVRCQKEGIAFFYKQSPGIRTEMGIFLDGQLVREFPKES